MRRLAHASILFALMTTVASAQARSRLPRLHRDKTPVPPPRSTSLPAESATVTRWYKQNIYDPADNKIGEIMDVLVDRDGKITALIVGVGVSSAWVRRTSPSPSIRSGPPPRTTINGIWS